MVNNDQINKILEKFELEELNSLRTFDTGIVNPVYLINEKYVLRIEEHRFEQNPGKLRRESVLLEILPKFNIPSPKLIGFDDSGELLEAPYILLKFISGTDLLNSFKNLTIVQAKEVSFQLGDLAKKFHKITANDLDQEEMFGTLDKWVSRTTHDFEVYWKVVSELNYISEEVKKEILDTFKKYKELKFNGIGKLSHGDFSGSNIQIKEGKIVGVFDFEYSFIGDPLWDLRILPINFNSGENFDKTEFLNGYGIEEFTAEEKIRLRMYCYHQGVWEIWATVTKFMPFGEEEIEEGKSLIENTFGLDLLH